MSTALQLEELIAPVVESMGYELWGCECRMGDNTAFVRVYIDHEAGITLDDCSQVSHQLSGFLDVEDPIKTAYTLEISSPGLDRPLLRAEHYERYSGEKVKIKLKWPVEGRRNFSGALRGLEDDQVIVEVDKQLYYLPYDAIDKSRLTPELGSTSKAGARA